MHKLAVENAGKIGLDVSVNLADIEASVDSAAKDIGSKFTESFNRARSNAEKSSAAIAGAFKKIAVAAVGAFAVKKVADFGKECLELGSDLAEVQNVVDVAFAFVYNLYRTN